MNKEDVIKEIESAFAGEVLGNGIGLWQAQAIDDYEPEETQLRFREKDEKEDWHLLEHDTLQRCHSSLSFFNPDGMRFHLPAYILASLNDRVDDPLFHLTHLDDYAKSKLVSLTQEQNRAVKKYLNWCLEQEEYEFERPMIKKALIEYWESA